MRISVLFVVALMLCQCAKKDDENLQDLADRSFNSLMALNYPQVTTKLESGMYIEWLRDVPGPTVVEGDWLMLNYRGETFGGQVFSTRYRDEAIDPEGTFTWRTRYTPHFMAYDETIGLSPGEIQALSLMSVGDSVRLYIPTKLGFGYSAITFQYGYEGWFNTSKNPNAVSSVSNIPVIVELSLKDIIKDPKTYELNAMISKAIELGFNLSVASDDRVTDSLFFHYTVPADPTHEIIEEDASFYISYTGRFLDDFVLKTNDPLVGELELHDTGSSFVPLSYNASSPPTALAEAAISEVIKKGLVRYDSEFRIIFTSVWGFGTTGQAATSTSPVVYPYTPLYYDIKTHPKGYDPNATED